MDYSIIAKNATEWAKMKIGCPYSQAKRLQEGIFDCSSLIARAYIAQGKKWLYGGSVPTSCQEVYDDDFELLWPTSYQDIGKKMGRGEAIAQGKRPGDIQYLCTDSSTARSNKITHVALVANNTSIVHARGKAYGVVMSPINTYSGKICAITRYNPACTLKKGMKGYRTQALQTTLNARGITIAIDGEYGSNTMEAVRAYQQKKGLKATGQADYSTLIALQLIGEYNTTIPNTGVSGRNDTENSIKHSLLVTGDTVHIRKGPGTEYQAIGIAKKGDIFETTDNSEWQPILVGKEVAWISTKYIKRNV